MAKSAMTKAEFGFHSGLVVSGWPERVSAECEARRSEAP